MLNKDKSLYKDMLDYFKDNPKGLYLNQDFEKAGEEETIFIFWGEDLPKKLQNKRAQTLLNHIYKYLKYSTAHKELIDYIKSSTFAVYYSAFYKLLDVHVKEDLIDKKKLYKAAIKFATESGNSEEIKVGIIMLAFFQNKEALSILQVLGTHSEYTLYVITALKRFDYYNSIIFKLAQKTYGYGKIHCLNNLEPVTNEIKNWIIEEGCNNTVLKSLSAAMCIYKVNMSSYLKINAIRSKQLSAISRLFCYILSTDQKNVYKMEDSLETVKLYLKYTSFLAGSFYDLCAIVYIKKCMRPYWQDIKKDVYKGNGWTSNIEIEIINRCEKILENKKWTGVLCNGLKTPEEEGEYYILAAEALDIKLNFEDFKEILKKDPYDIAVYYYLKENWDEKSLKKLLSFVKESFPFGIICSGPQNITKEDITEEFKPDICLLYTLNGLQNMQEMEFELPLKSLYARLCECRIEAISCLRRYKGFWTEDVEKELRKVLEVETDKSIKRRIKRLLGEKEYGIKERKYVDISKESVKPHVKDIYLFSTEAAGVFYRDMSVVEDELEAGDLLFLKREPDNPYDENAIMLTTEEGYMVGYIPRRINTQPKNLMDGGKYLYGKIKELSIDRNYLLVDIYLSYKDVQDTVMDIMKMTQEPMTKFIQ